MDSLLKAAVEYAKKYVNQKTVSAVLLYAAMMAILRYAYKAVDTTGGLSERTLEMITASYWIIAGALTIVVFVLGIKYIVKYRTKEANESAEKPGDIELERTEESITAPLTVQKEAKADKKEEDGKPADNKIEAFVIEQDDKEREKKFIEINENVKKEYWVLGVSLSALPKKENKLKQWASTGIDLRLCMLDADMTISELCRESIEHGYCSIKNYIESSENADITPEKIIEMIQNAEIKCQQDCKDFLALYHVLINSVHFKEYYHTSRDYKKTIQSSYTDLKNIADDIGKDRHGKYKLQLRFADSFIPLSMTVKDASLDMGSMVVEFQLPFTNKKILIMLEKAEKEEMFNEFVDLYKEVWERANQANE